MAYYSDQAESTANRARVAEYFWRESGKWAQKVPPEGFGGLRFYGRWGAGFNPVVTADELDERVGYEIRRVLRRMMLGKLQESASRTGRPLKRNAGRSRGRDGLTVFGVDGVVWGPKLRAWAEETVRDKVARAGVEPAVDGSGVHPRALAERPPIRYRVRGEDDPGYLAFLEYQDMMDALGEMDPEDRDRHEAWLAREDEAAAAEEAQEAHIREVRIERARERDRRRYGPRPKG